MYVNPFQVSLETLLGAAPILGHALEDRSGIRQAQDWRLVKRLQALTSHPLRGAGLAPLFSVAPLDVLVTRCPETGRKSFHIIEINGTGIGGLTNLTGEAVSAVLDCFFQEACGLPMEDPLILVASSGKENDQTPRLNKLLHEKLLYAEALKRGFDYTGRPAQVLAMPHLAHQPKALEHGPAVVIGYMKDFLEHLRLENDGALSLLGRNVSALVNDRFCLNVHQHFGGRVDWGQVWTMNRGFLAGADKGIAYTLLNQFLKRDPAPALCKETAFERVGDRDELLHAVLRWLHEGRKPVIKPQGTGLGHGIEFFLDPAEPAAHVAARIDRSVRLTEAYYRLPGGAFPYTVCEFLDACTVARQGHALFGHKFELRIVVYRDSGLLRAFPSIAKVASEKYDARHPAHLSLINNVTTSAQAKNASGVEFMLPLANQETLDLLDISWADLVRLCAGATRFVGYIVDQVEQRPELFALPSKSFVSRPAPSAV